jgi:hypothetical protein
MLSSALAASLLMSVPAAADQPNAMDKMENKVVTALTGDEIGDGPVIEIDVYQLFGGTNGLQFNSPSGVGTTPLIVVPAIHVGYEWDQMAALIGAQFIFTSGAPGQNGPVQISIPLTFRRYLKPLRVFKFAPFLEGDFDLNFVVPGGGGLNFGFGIEAGFGGEYIFAENFGLFGKALLSYQYIPSALGGNTVSTNAIGVGGVLGVLVHF